MRICFSEILMQKGHQQHNVTMFNTWHQFCNFISLLKANNSSEDSPQLKPPTFDNYFCWYCGHEIWDKHKNKLIRESYWFIFKRLQNNITCPLCKKHLDKQHQTVTLSEIVIFGIKKSWVKFIIGTKSKHY